MNNKLGAAAVFLIKQVVKVGAKVVMRGANEAAGKPIPSLAIDVGGECVGEFVDALHRWLAKTPKEQVSKAIEEIAVADPREVEAEAERAIGDEMPGAGLEVREQLKATIANLRENAQKELEPENNQGKTVIRPDFELRTVEDVRKLVTRPGNVAPGDEIDGRYIIRGKIGAGGMGAVYIAFDKRMNEEMVLKTVLPHLAAMPQFTQRLFDECKYSRGLSHHHIVRTHDAGFDLSRKMPYITMEYVPGITLHTWLGKRSQAVTLEEFTNLMRALCRAMSYAHRPQRGEKKGMLHLDLKPGNIMVSEDLSTIVVLDFGLGKARTAGAALVSVQGGTNYYMAPEQRDGLKVDERADVYALGMTFYQILTRKVASGGSKPVAKLRSDLPAAISNVIADAMENDPAERIADVDVLRRRMEEALMPPVATGEEASKSASTAPRSAAVAMTKELEGDTYAVKAPAGEKQAGTELAKSLTNSIGMKLMLIPKGSFLMGSPTSEVDRIDNETQHRVTISKPFYMGATQVTQDQWKAIMGGNPSKFTGEDKLPVESVSYEDAVGFCEQLSWRDGRTYRVPTEAQWEYACRAGTETPFHFGKTITTAQANWNGNYPYNGGAKEEYRQKTTPVGIFDANPWGLYDMHGNVWEWCRDWYAAYPKGNATDPVGPAKGVFRFWRVLRGGSWFNGAWRCRSASRGFFTPGSRNNNVGFRVSLDSD